MLERVGIAGEENPAGRSLLAWADIPVSQAFFDINNFYGISERFVNAPLFASGVSQGGAITYQDTGGTIQGVPYLGGALKFLTDGTDNDENWHTLGANVGSAFKIDLSAPKDFVHEQVIVPQVLAEHAMAIGMSEEGRAVADQLVDDTGALASKDFIGFHCPTHASAAVFSAVYRTAGQPMVTVESGVHTCTADEVLRLAVRLQARTKKLFWYVNGAEVASVTNPTWATFPNQQMLVPLRGHKAGSAAAKSFLLLQSDTYARR